MIHKVYQGDSTIPEDSRPHTFVELEPDSYVEVLLPKIDRLNEPEIKILERFITKTLCDEKSTGQFNLRCAYRYFKSISPVPNLKLIGEVNQ